MMVGKLRDSVRKADHYVDEEKSYNDGVERKCGCGHDVCLGNVCPRCRSRRLKEEGGVFVKPESPH